MTLLVLSSKPMFLEKINMIEMFKHCFDGVVYKQYQAKDYEMKSIILEVCTSI